MKCYFPLFFILFLICSCSKNKNVVLGTDPKDSINTYIIQGRDTTLNGQIRFQAFKKAQVLAENINNDSIVLNIAYSKLYYFSDSLSTLKNFKKVISRSKNPLHDNAFYSLMMAQWLLRNKKNDSAFYYFNTSKNLYEHEKDSLSVSYNLMKMAELQQLINDYSESEQSLTEFLRFTNSNKNGYLSEVYNMLGVSYSKLNDFNSALNYYNKALSIAKGDTSKQVIQNNKALIYFETHEYDKAVDLLSNLRKSKEINAAPKYKVMVLNNLGYALFKQDGISGKAETEEALEIAAKNRDDNGLLSSYKVLSEYYFDKNPATALSFVKLSYKKASEMNRIDDRIEALKQLTQLSEGNVVKKYSQLYTKLVDSIKDVRQQSRNNFAKIKYDSTLSNKENSKLKAERELIILKEEKTRLLYISGFVIFLSASVSFFFWYRAKSNKEKQAESYNTETRISKKLHDELANDVFHTMTFAETQDLSSDNNKETLLNNLDNIYSRTRNISKENSNIDTGPNYIIHLKEMISSYNNNKINVLFNGLEEYDWDKIDDNKKIIIYRIVQELLVNMKKHSNCTRAAITFRKLDNKMQINYSDDGIGITQDKIIIKNGLQNVENRIHSVKGTITFDTINKKGFKVSLILPI